MNDSKKLEFLWFDHKMHEVLLSNGAETLDIEPIREMYKKVVEDKKDQCKNIYFLGAGLCGTSDAAHGFLLGWLVKSIRDDIVKKDGTRILIQHEEREITEDETRDHIVTSLLELADEIKNSTDKLRKVPLVRGDVDGGELF